MVTRDEDGRILLFERPDKIEKAPFPVYAGVWTLTAAMLESFSVTGELAKIRHSCGELVAIAETDAQLADVVAAISNHVCERTP